MVEVLKMGNYLGINRYIIDNKIDGQELIYAVAHIDKLQTRLQSNNINKKTYDRKQGNYI